MLLPLNTTISQNCTRAIVSECKLKCKHFFEGLDFEGDPFLDILKNNFGAELSTLQRAASHCASRVDILEAYEMGGAAMKAADEGDSGKMVIIQRVSMGCELSGAIA